MYKDAVSLHVGHEHYKSERDSINEIRSHHRGFYGVVLRAALAAALPAASFSAIGHEQQDP